MQLGGRDRIKSDEQIMGDSDFVMEVLSQADEKHYRQYELKRLRYDPTLLTKISILIL